MKSMKKMPSRQLPAAMLLCGLLVFAQPATDIVPFTDITPAQAAALIKEKSADPLFVILDTRTAMEFAENRIQGAVNIDIKAAAFMDEVGKLDKNGVYLVYCKGGVRSAKAMNLMKGAGFREIYNLGGGLLRWQKETLPLEGKPLTTVLPLKIKGMQREERVKKRTGIQ